MMSNQTMTRSLDDTFETKNLRCFLQSFECQVKQDPNKPAMLKVNNKGEIEHELDFAKLWVSSNRLAHRLSTKSRLKKGDRAAIVYPPGLDFLIAMLACF